MLHNFPVIGKNQLPINCLDDVLKKWCYKITQVLHFNKHIK